jgi:hypothetical protein
LISYKSYGIISHKNIGKEVNNMDSRKHIPPRLRKIQSKLRQLINQGRFIKGTIYYLRNTCGKENCKCRKGEKHESLYIQQVKKHKTKKSIIPKAKWDEVKQKNKNYREIIQLMEEVSDYEWEHLKEN